MTRFMTGLRCHLYMPASFGQSGLSAGQKNSNVVKCAEKRMTPLPFASAACEVLGSFDVDALPHGVGPAEPTHRHLDDRQAQRLEVLHEYSRTLLGRQLAQADVDVARGDAAARPAAASTRARPNAAPERHLRAERQQHDEPHPGVPEPGDGVAQRRELRGPEVI